MTPKERPYELTYDSITHTVRIRFRDPDIEVELQLPDAMRLGWDLMEILSPAFEGL